MSTIPLEVPVKQSRPSGDTHIVDTPFPPPRTDVMSCALMSKRCNKLSSLEYITRSPSRESARHVTAAFVGCDRQRIMRPVDKVKSLQEPSRAALTPASSPSLSAMQVTSQSWQCSTASGEFGSGRRSTLPGASNKVLREQSRRQIRTEPSDPPVTRNGPRVEAPSGRVTAIHETLC